MWLRTLRSWLGLIEVSKTRGGRQRSLRRARLCLERLEDRITPTGQKVAYHVAGLGGHSVTVQGGQIKIAVDDPFPQTLIDSLNANHFEVDLANWNSSDYL